MFSGGIDGRGVSKKDRITDYNIVNFFKLYGRNFGNIVKLNLLFVFGNFPILFYLFARSGNISTPSVTASNILYSSFRGVLLSGQFTPVTAAMNGILGYRTVNYVPTTVTYVFLALTALIVLTFGVVNVGTAYIMRNIVRCEPIFFMSDFFYAIKRNWKQALPFGILDGLFCALLVYDVVFFYYNIGPFFNNVCFYLSLVLTLVYFVMRFYIYVMMLTFDLSIFKLLKNALIFTVLGFKRNVSAVIGMILFLLVCYGVFLTYAPLGMLLPLLVMFSSMAFMAIYASYPKIKAVMIDPYYKDEPEEDDAEEPVFHDMG
ncbi:MAG: DUF624 domain-containing protein [Clostridia bacterium]|nr:DUF624 domain-containing protein [Clostridia bacterium]